MFSLANKTALVTGATGGIGEAIAKALHGAGATVILSGTRSEKLDEMVAAFGERAHAIAANLGDRESVDALAEKTLEIAGGLDILVNNAGLTRDNLSMRLKDEDWDTVLEVNLTSAFRLSRALMRSMMKKRFGRIINMTSVVGVTGNPGQANYCASKAGMIGMSKSMAQEVAARGITVNCIAPGFIRSPMTDALTEKQRADITDNIPSGSIGEPEDIAAAVLYLASDYAGYVTGQTLHVNGGLAML